MISAGQGSVVITAGSVCRANVLFLTFIYLSLKLSSPFPGEMVRHNWSIDVCILKPQLNQSTADVNDQERRPITII